MISIIYTTMSTKESTKTSNTFLNKIGIFESNHGPFINIIFKPLLTLMVFLSVGYYTMWLSTNYLKTDKFVVYAEKQILSDKQQDETSKSRFEITQTKLETIINQQVAYTEQLKAYNQILSNFQKQVDTINDRLIYLERHKNSNQ